MRQGNTNPILYRNETEHNWWKKRKKGKKSVKYARYARYFLILKQLPDFGMLPSLLDTNFVLSTTRI